MSVVYFLQEEPFGFIKIGFSSNDAESRRQDHQVGNGRRLRTLLEVPGDRSLEDELKKRFAPHRAREDSQEWFFPVAEILEYIDTQLYGRRWRNSGESLPVVIKNWDRLDEFDQRFVRRFVTDPTLRAALYHGIREAKPTEPLATNPCLSGFIREVEQWGRLESTDIAEGELDRSFKAALGAA